MAARHGKSATIVLRPVTTTQAQAKDLGLLYLAPVKSWSQSIREDVLPAYSDYDVQPTLLETQLDTAKDSGIRKAMTAAGSAGLALWLAKFSAWHIGYFARVVKAGVDIDISPLTSTFDVTSVIEAATSRNEALFRSVADDIANRVTNIAWSGVRAGLTEQQVVQQFNAALQIVNRRALNIGIDQTVKIGADLDKFRAAQAGLGEYMWHHTSEEHPRIWHKARNGKVYSWAKPPYDGPPGSLPHCKCRAQSIVGLAKQ